MIAPPPLPATPLLQPVHLHHSGLPLVVVRQEHLTHENALKSLGILHLLSGGLLALSTVLMGLSLIFALIGGGPLFSGKPEDLVIMLLVPVLAVVQIQVGIGLHRLNPSVRSMAIALACVGLLGFPLGTLINAVVLSYLLSKKGTFVLTDEYRGIIAQTPHVKAKTSIAAVILLVFVLALFAAALLVLFL